MVYGRRREKRTDDFLIWLKSGGGALTGGRRREGGADHSGRAALLNPNAPDRGRRWKPSAFRETPRSANWSNDWIFVFQTG